MYTHVHSHSIDSKGWKQPKCPWMDGWISGWIHRTGSIHTVEYDSAMKRSEALTQATAWMDPEHTTLSERSRHRRTHILLFHLCEMSSIIKSTETKNGFLVARVHRELGVRTDYSMGTGSPFGGIRIFWNWTEERVAQYCECAKCPCIIDFKRVNCMLCDL